MADTVDFSIAVQPNDLGAVPALVESIVDQTSSLSPGDEIGRHALLIKARTLVQALETPRETMTKHTWAQVCATTTLAIVHAGIDLIWPSDSWGWMPA